MAVQLKDAEIKVKLDLSDSEKSTDSLEKRTKEERKEREKDREKQREKDRKERGGRGGRGGRRGGGIGRMLGAGALVSGFRGLVTAAGSVRLVPIVGHAVKAAVAATLASMAMGEMNEHFGPYVRGIVSEALPPGLKPAIAVIDAVGGSGQWWIDLKRELQAVTGAVGGTKLMVGALGVAGEKITPELIADIYEEEYESVKHRILLEKKKARFRKFYFGAGIGKAVEAKSNEDAQKRLEAGINK